VPVPDVPYLTRTDLPRTVAVMYRYTVHLFILHSVQQNIFFVVEHIVINTVVAMFLIKKKKKKKRIMVFSTWAGPPALQSGLIVSICLACLRLQLHLAIVWTAIFVKHFFTKDAQVA
jgi:hypothetical protein